MLPLDPEQELKALDRKMIWASIIDAPGMILIGLGAFGKFSSNPGGLHPLLANSTVTTGMLVLGGLIAAWGMMQILSIARRRHELHRKLNT